MWREKEKLYTGFRWAQYVKGALAKDVKSRDRRVHSRKYLPPRSKADMESPTPSHKASSFDRILPLLYPYNAGDQTDSQPPGWLHPDRGNSSGGALTPIHGGQERTHGQFLQLSWCLRSLHWKMQQLRRWSGRSDPPSLTHYFWPRNVRRVTV